MEVQLLFSYPASKKNNKQISAGKIRSSEDYRTWHSMAKIEYQKQMRDNPTWKLYFPLTIVDELHLELIYADKIHRDTDNALTSIQDFLKDVGVIKEDHWMVIRRTVLEPRAGDRTAVVVTLKFA